MNVKDVNQIVAVGSVDGILTTAALLRYIGNPCVGLVFCQAFTVDKLDISGWKPSSRVAFVDLAVNNRDKKMTADFVHRVREAGHQIVAVCDEHCREDWLECIGTFDGLLIEPVSQAQAQPKSSTGKILSSGALLLVAMNSDVSKDTTDCPLDEHARVLCHLADEADQMRFMTIGNTVNKAVKSRIGDDSRRVYLARHFAQYLESDDTIKGWVAEYDAILRTHEEILAAKQDLGNGIVRVNAVGRTIDMTTLMSQLYGSGVRVVVLEGEMFDKSINSGKGGKVRMVSFGTNEKVDLLTCIKAVVPTASGFAQKVNIAPESDAVALEAVRVLLK
ncbi:MAG: hypothetical protein NTZ38_00030 [Candidatus Taylorbacteria bacterium]|nr:hypothetical protein [Candidatus Taylorbacteria bacterium]